MFFDELLSLHPWHPIGLPRGEGVRPW